MAAIVRPNQAHNEAVARRPSTARSSGPRLTVVRGGRSTEHLAIVYRRRRAVAAVAALLLLGVLVFAGRTVALAVAPAPPGSGPAVAPTGEVTEVVVVQPGDTLWALARRLRPEGDVRPLVDRLADAHGPGPLQPGDQLEVSVDPG
jgi:nucleoid-associated protein YgaU